MRPAGGLNFQQELEAYRQKTAIEEAREQALSRIDRSIRLIARGAMGLAGITGTTAVVAMVENAHLPMAAVAYWQAEKEVPYGEYAIENYHCGVEATEKMRQVHDAMLDLNLRGNGYQPDDSGSSNKKNDDMYSEKEDKLLQEVGKTTSSASRVPAFRQAPHMYEGAEKILGLRGNYFDIKVAQTDLEIGSIFEVWGSTHDQKFTFNPDELERLISDLFERTDLYINPYIRKFVECRKRDILESREYEGQRARLHVVADDNKALDGNHVVTVRSDSKAHSYGLGIGGVGTSLFMQGLSPDALLIITASGARRDQTTEERLNKRAVEEVVQWIISGDNVVAIASEFIEHERLTDYIYRSLLGYYWGSDTLPKIIELSD